MIHSDLHIHSQFSSDGELRVAEIIDRCRVQGVDLFSITDHNSVKATQEAHTLSQQAGVDFIAGIEIDCCYEGTDLHLLGYNIDWDSKDFLQLEQSIGRKVMDSFSEMINNLNRLGFIIDADAVLVKANGKLPTAELIAEVMLADEKYFSTPLRPYMKGGARADMPYINFYLDYFAQGKPAFVPIKYMSYNNAIQMVKENGGTPIIAHAGLNFRGNERVVERLLECGAEGLEVFNNYHSAEQIDYFASVVLRHNGIMTCGSDFHGHTKPLINIGQYGSVGRYKEYLNDCIRERLWEKES